MQNPQGTKGCSTPTPNNLPTQDYTALIKTLQTQMEELRNENKELKHQIAALLATNKKSYSPVDTDEEEEIVNKETAWLLPKNKKRKATNSPEKNETVETSTNANPRQALKSQKPPPVILSNLTDYTTMSNSIKSKNIKFTTTLLNSNQLKINVNTENEYRELTKHMNETNQEWHSYENKQNRPIRVLAKNLHKTCSPAAIKDDLTTCNFKIMDVTPKYKRNYTNGKETATALTDMFILTFNNTEDIKKIFEIQYICNSKVKIEALRTSKLIPQCKKCQRFGHTQNYCQRAPVCVKCAGKHLTAECKKTDSAPPKCSNCSEPHPASYRGCIVAKELQKRRNNINKPKATPAPNQHRQNINTRTVNEHVTYAEVAGPNNVAQPIATEAQTLTQMMQNMMSTLNKLTERIDKIEINNAKISRQLPQWVKQT